MPSCALYMTSYPHFTTTLSIYDWLFTEHGDVASFLLGLGGKIPFATEKAMQNLKMKFIRALYGQRAVI